ncbi:hypothetical protein Pst134EA_021028 [Puccinia striiformis f. sp. tritici]|uniref:hypothetical protein n=1 Tax=Puccinia striiformis f. sp. tritici TaxID=168172 RepID=UPI002008074C|nr:hypothetical protein Pst134EA_021028 [Puccinia striiformis f. sp. tritici]KAH9457135.1 hypothetical protein Pst134EA_021028 [Puccinia striiformis f. sp. tritici]
MKTFLSFILIISRCIVMGMHPPNEILAPLQRESCIGNRDGISPSMSPPRAVKLLPDDKVSIDIPPYDHVSSYDKTVSKYNAENKIPPKEVAAINTYPAGRQARGIPIPSRVATTQNRSLEDHGCNATCLLGCGIIWLWIALVGGVFLYFTL